MAVLTADCSMRGWSKSWWRHQMETFSVVLAIYAGNSPVPGEFPAQRLVTRSFHVCFDLRLNKRLNKQSWGWLFETLSRPLWRHCNVLLQLIWERRTKPKFTITQSTVLINPRKMPFIFYFLSLCEQGFGTETRWNLSQTFSMLMLTMFVI